jgi:hypothetical protein
MRNKLNARPNRLDNLPLPVIIKRYGGYPLHLAWVLLLFSSIAWASNSSKPGAANAHGIAASGGLSGTQGDVKLLFVFTALAIILVKGRFSTKLNGTIVLIGVYGIWSLIGAFLSHLDVFAALESTLRLGLSVLMAVWIVRSTRIKPLLLSAAWMTSAIAFTSLAAYAVGENPVHQGGLGGYLPPLQANGLGGLMAIGGLIIIDLWMSRGWLSRGWWLGLLVTVVALGLTDSRSSIGALGLGVMVLLVAHRKGKTLVVLIVVGLLALGVSTFHIGSTTILDTIIDKGHSSSSTATLARRVDEGAAAIAAQKNLKEKTFGQGIPQHFVMQVGVKGLEPVDTSWYASYLEAGLGGVLIMFFAVLNAGRIVAKRRFTVGIGLWLVIFTLSITSTIFNDLSPGMLLVVALTVEGDGSGYFRSRAEARKAYAQAQADALALALAEAEAEAEAGAVGGAPV